MLQRYVFNPTGHVLFSLTAKHGGMGLFIPLEICWEGYKNSQENTKETTNKVMHKEIQFQDNHASTIKRKNNIKNQKTKLRDANLQDIADNTLRSVETSRDNGASIWLTVITTKRNGFFLEKQAFWHAI